MSDAKHDSSDEGSADRRGGERHLACFPAYIERPDGEPRTSIIHDLSTTGALLLVRTKLAPGEAVKLELFLTDDVNQSRPARGKVVRQEPLGDEETGLWRHRVAVQFDEPLVIDEAELTALRQRLARLGR